jgi:2-polyprenyl-3-methyl-5-hydroxy-6-metoxy-1,4-benzoquinol methylase
MKINSQTFAMRLKRIKKKLENTGKMLDFGCALGDCLTEAIKLGWKKPEGLDTSVYACGQCRKRGLKIHNGTLDTVKLEPNTFDLVTSQDVIEHITDPVAELKKIFKIMKPGSILFLVTPEMGGRWQKLLKGWWYHYKPGEHVVYFSQDTMKKALSMAGYTNITTSSTPHIMSVEYIFKRLAYYSPVIFNLLLKISNWLSLGQKSLKVYTGEMEAWAEKP